MQIQCSLTQDNLPNLDTHTIWSVFIHMTLIYTCWAITNHSCYHNQAIFIAVAPTADCICCAPCSVHNNLFFLLWSEDRRNAPYANPFPATALGSQLHGSNALFYIILFHFFETGILCSFGACPGTSSCRPGWLHTHRDLPTSASQVLGLKACTTTARKYIILKL